MIEGGYDGTGNLDIEPGFIDSENDNYGLIASSMLINAGNPNILDEDGQLLILVHFITKTLTAVRHGL